MEKLKLIEKIKESIRIQNITGINEWYIKLHKEEFELILISLEHEDDNIKVLDFDVAEFGEYLYTIKDIKLPPTAKQLEYYYQQFLTTKQK